MGEIDDLARNLANRAQADRIIGLLEQIKSRLNLCLYALAAILFLTAAIWGLQLK